MVWVNDLVSGFCLRAVFEVDREFYCPVVTSQRGLSTKCSVQGVPEKPWSLK